MLGESSIDDRLKSANKDSGVRIFIIEWLIIFSHQSKESPTVVTPNNCNSNFDFDAAEFLDENIIPICQPFSINPEVNKICGT